MDKLSTFDAEMAYRNRKLDIAERALALQERQITLDEQKWAHHVETESKMHDSFGALRDLIANADEDDHPISRNSRGRA